MRLSHADFRPGKRTRFVPSGSPRRKFPLIRIVLLLGLGVFLYARFEALWVRVRDSVNPVALWHKAFDGSETVPVGELSLAWSRDSSRVTLECPRGLTGTCCEALTSADPDLCGEAAALLEKGRWRRAIARGPNDGSPVQLEARAVVSDLGDWGYELSGLRGRDPAGVYLYRRGAGSSAWCDARRGCLRPAHPRPPLADGRLQPGLDNSASVWISSSPRVRAILPGRVVAVVATETAHTAGTTRAAAAAVAASTATIATTRVRVYHGGEVYATYGPLRPAPGVKTGALVKAGSHLGDAPDAAGGAGGYVLSVTVRQGGQNMDPAAFWGERSPPPEEASGPLLYSGIP